MNVLFRKRNLTAVLLVFLLVTVSGCNDGDDPVQVVQDPVVEPRTPEILLASFRTAYENKDSAAYLALLEPDFQFLLQQVTAARFPDLGASLDLAEEERIHLRMFSGEAVTDPGGDPRPGVREVVFQTFQALDGWNASDDAVNFPDAAWAPFSIELIVDCGQEFTTYRANGQVKIYVREYTDTRNGKEVKYYKLAGMVDLTLADKGVERTPWGLIKAFYS